MTLAETVFGRRSPLSLRLYGLFTVLAVAYALLQRSPWAPFPHHTDDLTGGIAMGSVVGLVLAVGTVRGWTRPRT